MIRSVGLSESNILTDTKNYYNFAVLLINNSISSIGLLDSECNLVLFNAILNKELANKEKRI